MSILDTDKELKKKVNNTITIYKINNIKAMKDFRTFANDYGETFVKLYYDLFHEEYFSPLSYTGIARYFLTEFPETRDYAHASSLIWGFLRNEGLVSRNSKIANMSPDGLAEVVKYVYEETRRENSQQILELLQQNKKAYAEKIQELCKDLLSQFEFLETTASVTAILSLITGWCPILHKKFVQITKNVSVNQIAKELSRAIDTMEPLIELGITIGCIQMDLPMIAIWGLLRFVKNIYNNYSNL